MGDRLGQQLGNYRLVKLLGKGGFAEVYLGQHVHLASKQAAIKILHLLDVDARKFQEEAETTEKLVHPHIVRLLDFALEEGTPFLVLDFAPGGSLRSHHARGSIVPLARVGAYLTEIVPALQYAHDLHILHRDIKPDNVLIGRQGELLVSDFGIAILTQTGRTSLSSTYGVGGTPYYMAPETYQGKPVKESDQYALAIMVYEWLCGSVPFTEGNFIQLGYQHTYNPVPSLRERNPAIPPDVETVVLKALAKEPKERFGSMQLFAQAFEQASTRTLPMEEPQQGQSRLEKQSSPDQSSHQQGKGQSSQQIVVQTPHSVQDETGRGGKAPPRSVSSEVMPVEKTEPPMVTPPNQSAVPTEPATSPHQALLPTEPATSPGRAGEPALKAVPPSSPVAGVPPLIEEPVARESGPALEEEKQAMLPDQGLLPTEPAPSPPFVEPTVPVPSPSSSVEPTVPATSSPSAPVWPPARRTESDAEPVAVPEPFQRRLSRRTMLYLGLVGAGVTVTGFLWLALSQQPAAPPVSSTSTSTPTSPTASSTPTSTPTSHSVETTLYTYSGHSAPVRAVAWSPNGNRIASGSEDKTVQVWDAANGGHVYTYRGHSAFVHAAPWSPDGNRIASGSEDKTVQVWDAANGGHVYTYRGHSNFVYAVAWSPDGHYIASGSEDTTVQVWDAANGGNIFRGNLAPMSAVAWSPDGRYIASGSVYGVQVWDVVNGGHVYTYHGHSNSVRAVAWSPDGKRIASGSEDKTVQVWDAANGGHAYTYQGHSGKVNAVAWSPDGKRIVSGSEDKTVQVWDAADGGHVYTYRGHSDWVHAVAWSPDGKRIASGSFDTTVQVWQAV